MKPMQSKNKKNCKGTKMPKYDYECLREGVVAEFDLAIDHNAPFCNTCGSVMRKVFTATPAIFKGKGWGSKP